MTCKHCGIAEAEIHRNDCPVYEDQRERLGGMMDTIASMTDAEKEAWGINAG